MALDTVNKIKQAEQDMTTEEALARRRADEYIKKSEDEAAQQASQRISLAQEERSSKIDLAKKQSAEILDKAKADAEKEAKALFEKAKLNEDKAVEKIIQTIVT